MKALVISGGGARGAWGVGVTKALSLDQGNDYQCLLGTSTGSLMGPLVLTKDFDVLEEAYTSVTQEDIFNVNPFNKKGKISFWNFLWRVLRKKNTIGESENLKKLIPKFLTQQTFDALRSQDKDFIATVTSITDNKVGFKSTKEYGYNDMVDWIWASGNQGVFMSILNKEGQIWADGGIKEFLPISQAINLGATHIDVIVHKPQKFLKEGWMPQEGILGMLLRVIDILTADVGEEDIRTSRLQAEVKQNVTLNFYYMTEALMESFPNSLVFDKNVMKKVLQEGYQSVIDGTVDKQSYEVQTNGMMQKTVVA